MKKLFFLVLSIVLLAACANDTSSNTEATPSQTNVENVNGNVPDSTNSINLNQPLPTDSSRLKDSVPH